MAKRGLLLLGAGAAALFAFSAQKKTKKSKEEDPNGKDQEEADDEEEVETPSKGSSTAPSKSSPSKSKPSSGAPLRFDQNTQTIQTQLIRLADFFGYSEWNPGAPDGKLGPNTIAAIRAFQSENGLSKTGAIDSDTLRAIEIWSELMEGMKAQNKKPRPGEVTHGDLIQLTTVYEFDDEYVQGGTFIKFEPLTVVGDVKFWKAVQRVLLELGYNSGKVDGLYGKNTKNAFKAFQTDWNMWIDWLNNNHDPKPDSSQFYRVSVNGDWSESMRKPLDVALGLDRSGEIEVFDTVVAYDWQSLMKWARANKSLGGKVKAVDPGGTISPSMDPSNGSPQKPPSKSEKYVGAKTWAGSNTNWMWPYGEKIGNYPTEVAKTLGSLDPSYYNKLRSVNFDLNTQTGMSVVSQFQKDWNRIQNYAGSSTLGALLSKTFGFKLSVDGRLGYHSCIALARSIDFNDTPGKWPLMLENAKAAGF